MNKSTLLKERRSPVEPSIETLLSDDLEWATIDLPGNTSMVFTAPFRVETKIIQHEEPADRKYITVFDSKNWPIAKIVKIGSRITVSVLHGIYDFQTDVWRYRGENVAEFSWINSEWHVQGILRTIDIMFPLPEETRSDILTTILGWISKRVVLSKKIRCSIL
jgi:hypothetical protein